jgi:hypothetical protein
MLATVFVICVRGKALGKGTILARILGVSFWAKGKDSSPLDGYFYEYFESVSERLRSTVDPPGLEPHRALK